MYDKVDSNLNFVDREKDIISFWKKNDIFNKSLDKNKDKKEFSFYDGPPTANGMPHIGHVLTRVIKDVIPRYKTMKGFNVRRKAGWDTHGLPVELEVEKSLGLDGKGEIEGYGVESFIKKCKESVFKYVSEWEKMSDRIGYWVDMDKPYVTYSDEYIESVWWSLSEIFKKGLIYKGHKIVPYCPRCGTALSSHEVAQGYKDVKDDTAVVKFKLKGDDNLFILAWTTTPWTLPSNAALCMHPDYEYSVVESEGSRYILAKELVGKHFEDGTYRIVETRKGKDFENLEYEPLFDFYNKTVNKDEILRCAQNDKKLKAHFITNDTYVTLDSGTGVVHIAPAFGEDDARVGKKYDLPFIQLVDEAGKFNSESGSYAGVFVKDADKHLIKELKEKGLLFSTEKYEHSYPFCWRCDTPLLYYARPTWFIKMTSLKNKLLKNNAKINWLPDSIGKGRMANFLENVVDWGLSRERYWGTPLPIWVCECGAMECIGSKAELIERGGIKKDIELHKPYVDSVLINCTKCSKKMKRTHEVIDCWYDSGSMPFAQYHYPFKNKDIFEKTFPAQFISEAVDQTRGWFYTLLAISALLFNKPAFKNCIVLGHVSDKNGIKMSKSKGNVVAPDEVIDKAGADAVRWYFYSGSALYLSSRFSYDMVVESQRKFLGTLWNTYSFYCLYADIDKFDPSKYNLNKCKLSLMDKWLLSGLNSLIEKVDKNLEDYKIVESSKEIIEFVDKLSNWYIRRSRERFWASGFDSDKQACFMTLYHTLKMLSLITAPFVPFMSEMIYQNIVRRVEKGAESVHLCDYPKADKKYIDKNLEDGMALILEAAYLGRAARNTVNIKTRQPLKRMLVASEKRVDGELVEILKGELNVKELEFINNADEYVSYELKPQLKTLGPKYGAKLGLIKQHLAENGMNVYNAVKDGDYEVELGGEKVVLAKDDILFNVINAAGFSAASGHGVSVILDIKLNESLIKEGYYRELVSKVQAMRKDSGFEVTDKIVLGVAGDDEIGQVIREFESEIKEDVQACKIVIGQIDGMIESNINGKLVKLQVKRV
ncbi:MAG: isoleucine--tRNA ligase [Firmicutes bacterium]|nr:isoleucine--tRNA ligase [Bacillota bacterium]